MSGFCGLAALDGAPVDERLLRSMTAALAFRGPDGLDCRVAAGAGLGFAALRTDPDVAPERQPLTFDGHTWIVADARIDAQGPLRAALAARGRVVEPGCGDAALVLHAWHAWGEDCARHLLGDFAFAIWDGARRRLFFARDRFGVKSLFHAACGPWIVFSNTIDGVRSHPGVPSTLDDDAIADFLLFEGARDPESTAFAAIRRIAPAGCLLAGAAGVVSRRYWSPPEAAVRYRRAGDYAEQLRETLRAAVGDRLRTSRVAVQMSGGLDSTAVAALARRALVARARPFDLQAHTIVYDRLLPDDERRHAGLAAAALGIPVRFHPGDADALYERFADYAARFPAPFHAPDVIVGFDSLRAAASHARVLLTGYDGDTLLSEPPRPYWRWLWRQRRFATLAASFARAAWRRRRPWPARAPGSATAPPGFPAWIDRDFAARLGLRERWREVHEARELPADALRPSAHRGLADIARATFLFDQYDPGVTGLALECRHPFLDLRVVELCLGLPPEPWCEGKHVLREAMKGILPEAVRLRPKTPLRGWAGRELLADPRSRWVDAFVPVPGLERFVDRRRIPPVHGASDAGAAWAHLRALTLNMWLQRSQSPTSKEFRHEIA